MCAWRVWAALACLAAAACAVPADAPSALAVLKCCAEGEELDTTSESEVRCQAAAFDPLDSRHEWRPHVYDPVRGSLLREIPAHWELRVGVVQCRRGLLRVPVEHDNTPSYVLFVNGSVYLTEYSMVVAGAGAYCLDARELLVCVPDEPEGGTAAASTAAAAPGPVVRK